MSLGPPASASASEAHLNQDITRYLDAAVRASRSAGDLIRREWNTPRNVRLKSDQTLVTQIDEGSEALIREILTRETPECSILGEEEGQVLGEGEDLWWYVDPVDGTTNLAHQFPWVCVSIALLRRGVPEVGICYNPIQEHFFCATRGGGATLNGEPIHVSSCSEMSIALLGTGFAIGSGSTGTYSNLSRLSRALDHCHDVRRAGSAALDLCSVAAGWLDGFWELGLHAWDTPAGWLMVQEAGGLVTDLGGGPYCPHRPEIIATNGHLHQALRCLLTQEEE